MTGTAAVQASVHLGAGHVWAVSDAHEFSCIAALWDRTAAKSGDGESGGGTLGPFDHIDDEYVLGPGGVEATALALARLIARAVGGCGISDADVLYLSYPTEWGSPRKGRLIDAARRVAHDVVVVPVATVAARVTRHAWRSRCVVVELHGAHAVSSVVRAVEGELRIEVTTRTDTADLTELFSGIGELSVRDAVVVIGSVSPASVAAVEHGLAGVRGHADVNFVDGRRIAASLGGTHDGGTPDDESSAHMIGAGAFDADWESAVPARAARSPGLGPEAPYRARGRHRARAVAALVAGVVVMLVASLLLWSGRDRREDPATISESVGSQRDSSVAADRTDDSSNRGELSPPTRRTSVDRVSLELPSDWTEAVRAPQSMPGRTDLVPASGADRKIVLVQKELTEGAEFDAVETALREQFSTFDDPLRFAEFAVATDAEGRRAVTYVEFPDDYSEVRWRVFVIGGLQVSVGCQYLLGEWGELAAECERAWQSVAVGA